MTSLKYSGGSNTEPIQNMNILKSGIGMVQFCNRTDHSKTELVHIQEYMMAYQKVPTIQKSNDSPIKQLWTIQNPNMFGIRALTVSLFSNYLSH